MYIVIHKLCATHPLYESLVILYVCVDTYMHTFPPRELVVKHLPAHHWLQSGVLQTEDLFVALKSLN